MRRFRKIFAKTSRRAASASVMPHADAWNGFDSMKYFMNYEENCEFQKRPLLDAKRNLSLFACVMLAGVSADAQLAPQQPDYGELRQAVSVGLPNATAISLDIICDQDTHMTEPATHLEPSAEHLAALAVGNLRAMLRHLRENPDHDKECALEVDIPVSALTEMLLRGEEAGASLKAIVWEILRRDGLIATSR